MFRYDSKQAIATCDETMIKPVRLLLKDAAKAQWKSGTQWHLLLEREPEASIRSALSALDVGLRPSTEADIEQLQATIEAERASEHEQLLADPTFDPAHDLNRDGSRRLMESIPRWEQRKPKQPNIDQLAQCDTEVRRIWPTVQMLIDVGKAQVTQGELRDMITQKRRINLAAVEAEREALMKWRELTPRPLSIEQILELNPETNLWSIWDPREEDWLRNVHLRNGVPEQARTKRDRLPAAFLTERAAHLAAPKNSIDPDDWENDRMAKHIGSAGEYRENWHLDDEEAEQ